MSTPGPPWRYNIQQENSQDGSAGPQYAVKRFSRAINRPRAAKRNSIKHLEHLYWIFALTFTLVVMMVVLKVPRLETDTPSVTPAPSTLDANRGYPFKKPGSQNTAYEETPAFNLEQHIKEIDLIVLQTLIRQGLTADNIKQQQVSVKHNGEEPYHHQTLIVSTPFSAQRLFHALDENLKAWSSKSALKNAAAGNSWTIFVADIPTHRLILEGKPRPVPPPPLKESTQSNLVIVIDDLGESAVYAKELAELPLDITFSILPSSTRSRQVISIARKHNKDYLLHLPMEPVGYPETADPGPDALFVHMGPKRLMATLKKNLDLVDGAIGVNNHMGSYFTQNQFAMRVIFAELKNRGMFFLDSMTAPSSAGPKVAQELGLPFIQRDIFIDNVPDPQLILYQLKKAEKLALLNGHAVAQGHPYPETLVALKKWALERNKNINICSIKKIMAPQMIAAGFQDAKTSIK